MRVAEVTDLQSDSDDRNSGVVDFVHEGFRDNRVKRQETDGVDLLGDQVIQRIALLFDTAARIEHNRLYARGRCSLFEPLGSHDVVRVLKAGRHIAESKSFAKHVPTKTSDAMAAAADDRSSRGAAMNVFVLRVIFSWFIGFLP